MIWNQADPHQFLLPMRHLKHILAVINKSQCLIPTIPMAVAISEAKARNRQAVHAHLEAAISLVTLISILPYEIRIYDTGMCLPGQACNRMDANGAMLVMLANRAVVPTS
jgi:hypothetical protein